MNTIKIFFKEDGTIESLEKDFNLYQGTFQDKLLNVFVPIQALAPVFRAFVNGEIVQTTIGNTSVKVGMTYTNQSGRRYDSKAYFMRYLKTVVRPNGQGKRTEYALYERKLPKEFTAFSGTGTTAPKLLVNIVSILKESLLLLSTSNPYLELTYDKSLYELKTTENTKFMWATNGWQVDGQYVNITEYGIQVNGTPQNGDIITATFTKAPIITSALTTQEITLEVMPSTYLDTDEAVEPSAFDELNATVNGLISSVASNGQSIELLRTAKQDKTDNSLATSEKTVVGAINGLKSASDEHETEITQNAQDIAELRGALSSGENFIGKIEVDTLPTPQELNGYVQAELDREPRNGDTIIVVLEIPSETDEVYKYFFSYLEWQHYQIPSTELASNSNAGIIQGTYQDVTHSIQVSIVGGKVNNILVYANGNYVPLTTIGGKVYVNEQNIATNTEDITAIREGNIVTGHANYANSALQASTANRANADGNGNNIAETYLTKGDGASKSFVRENFLPNDFNNIFYLNSSGNLVEEKVGLYSITASSSVWPTPISFGVWIWTSNDTDFVLSAKNSSVLKFHARLTEGITPNGLRGQWRLKTTAYENPSSTGYVLSIVLSPDIKLTGTSQEFTINSIFDKIEDGAVVKITNGSLIVRQLEFIPQESTRSTIQLINNTTYPITVSMSNCSQVVATQQGKLGELPVYNTEFINRANGVVNFALVGQSPALVKDTLAFVRLTYPQDTALENTDNIRLYRDDTLEEELPIITPYLASGETFNTATFGVLKQAYTTTQGVDENATTQFLAFLHETSEDNLQFMVDIDNLDGLSKATNLENGVGNYAIQQKFTKNGQDYKAQATGENAVAFGGKRYDKLNESGIVTDTTVREDIATAQISKNGTVASGKQAFASGGSVQAEGDFSIASGYYSKASGKGSRASGAYCYAHGKNSVAEGGSCFATADYSSAKGEQATASGRAAHAEGVQTNAIGIGAHAEGVSTRAYGDASHAEGKNCEATLTGSHAEGISTQSNHIASTTMGDHTKSSRAYQLTIGEFNKEDFGALFIVGNGNSETDRKNAFEVHKDGSVWADGAKVLTSKTQYHGNDGYVTLRPNVYFVLTAVSPQSFTFNFAEGNEADEYKGRFTTGSTVPAITFPSTVKWVGGFPDLATDTIYQFSIIDNIGVIVGVSL